MNKVYKCDKCNKFIDKNNIIEMKWIENNVENKKYKCIDCYNNNHNKKSFGEMIKRKKEGKKW